MPVADLRRLPHRAEAESAVLGGIMLRGRDALDEVQLLISELDFYVPANQVTFAAMVMLASRRQPIDAITLEVELRKTGALELVGGIEGLARLDRYATSHNIKAHAELVRDAAIRRKGILLYREAAETLYDDLDEEGLAAAISHTQHELARLASSSVGGTALVSMREACIAGWKALLARASPDTSPIVRYGFPKLDERIGGALPGELVVIAALTGDGKTALAGQIALFQCFGLGARRGELVSLGREARPTLFATNEQQTHELALRMVSQDASVDGRHFRAPKPDWIESHSQKLIQSFGRLEGAPITLAYRPRYTLSQFTADCRLWHRRETEKIGREHDAACKAARADGQPDPAPRKLGPILADYLQRWVPDGLLARESSRERVVNEIASEHKSLATELAVPVIAFAQLNDESRQKDRRPRMSDIRESRAVGFHADTIGLFWRPERARPEADRDNRRKEYTALMRVLAREGKLNDEQTKRAEVLYKASLHARLAIDKMRGGPADDIFDLEFTPQFTRVLDAEAGAYES